MCKTMQERSEPLAELRVMARWINEALQVLDTLDGEDSEDGGESLRKLRSQGDRLVRAALDLKTDDLQRLNG